MVTDGDSRKGECVIVNNFNIDCLWHTHKVHELEGHGIDKANQAAQDDKQPQDPVIASSCVKLITVNLAFSV